MLDTFFRLLGSVFDDLNNERLIDPFLGLATENSLVLIDELGRGTSPREGVGISHAIAEALIAAKVRSIHPYYHSLMKNALLFS